MYEKNMDCCLLAYKQNAECNVSAYINRYAIVGCL